MAENWNRGWTDWRIFFGLMLKYWNHPLRTTATAFLATTRPLRACQGTDQPILDIETTSHMLRLLSSCRSLPLSMATKRWTLEIPCLRLHPSLQSTATSSSRACNNNNNKTIIIPNQCNPGKHLNFTPPVNRRSNRRV